MHYGRFVQTMPTGAPGSGVATLWFSVTGPNTILLWLFLFFALSSRFQLQRPSVGFPTVLLLLTLRQVLRCQVLLSDACVDYTVPSAGGLLGGWLSSFLHDPLMSSCLIGAFFALNSLPSLAASLGFLRWYATCHHAVPWEARLKLVLLGIGAVDWRLHTLPLGACGHMAEGRLSNPLCVGRGWLGVLPSS